MCLSRVDSEPKDYGTKIGYKYMLNNAAGQLRLPHYYVGCNDIIPPLEWVESEQHVAYDAYDNSYDTGFHIFVNQSDAVERMSFKEVVVEVEFDGVIHTGYESGTKPTVVAKRMRILRVVVENK